MRRSLLLVCVFIYLVDHDALTRTSLRVGPRAQAHMRRILSATRASSLFGTRQNHILSFTSEMSMRSLSKLEFDYDCGAACYWASRLGFYARTSTMLLVSSSWCSRCLYTFGYASCWLLVRVLVVWFSSRTWATLLLKFSSAPGSHRRAKGR